MTDGEQGGEVVKLHKHAGRTPESRQRQRANLKPAAAVQHGAYSADRLQPARERVLDELLVSFDRVRRDWLEVAAAKRARVELLTAYADARGVIAHKGRGSTFPAIALLQREEASYCSLLERIETMQREAGAASAQDRVEAHLRAAYDGEGGDDGEEV
jgi:hypothetical protein